MATLLFAPAASPSSPPSHKSQWLSPVPYMFGGLAAMLGLIAFALLILACSFWKLENPSDGDIDLEAGGGKAAPPVFEKKYLVIMAGQDKPTYLATQRSISGVSSFGSNKNVMSSESSSMSLDENCQEKVVETSVHIN